MNDQAYIRRSLELAKRGRGRVSPNPLVGALVVAPDDTVLGEGWHEGPGSPHAEPVALSAAGDAARGATLYVSLEPCNHTGATPPCCEAIIAAGIARVVVAIGDPNPLVDGAGIQRLREAGISVELAGEETATAAARSNAAFFAHVRTGRPFVTLKAAATLDGKTAARDGSSTWITSEESRADVQRLRAEADAVMVGSGTVLADDPRLTARDPSYTGAPPLRVVLDATGRTPADAKVLDGQAPSLVFTTDIADPDAVDAILTRGAEVAFVDADTEGGVNLAEVLDVLGKRDVQSVLLEGGSTVAERSVRRGLVDRVIVFLAPLVLGGREAPGILGGEGFATLAEAVELDIGEVRRSGPDIRVEADVHRDH
ncbi:MAG: bifunctional diaminohydroxyphosphoribosylaminopyrimidine deaminase/5-amino-6-(5-phosphoribosylamino)uracil reductase RibD [Actinomycetota bacterium]